jgi:hypothetical protein
MTEVSAEEDKEEDKDEINTSRHRRRKDRFGRRGFNRDKHSRNRNKDYADKGEKSAQSSEPVILYNSHEDIVQTAPEVSEPKPEGKKTWWKKLIKS